MGTCSCASPFRACGTACVDPRSDDANCGACGAACGATSSCAAGACLPDDCGADDCDPLSVCYQGLCTERACVGVSCPGGQACHGGTCGCKAGELQCTTPCANPKLDNANCGSCGNACSSGTRCAASQCLPTSCGTTTCDPLSVCFQGGCVEASCVGVACSGGKVCSAGSCQCPAGKTDCSGTCNALQVDATHCGTCSTVCPGGQACVAGQCVANACTGGKTMCGGSCVDTQSDPANCNACGAACGGGRNCVSGACACPSGLTYCGTACVNLGTDTSNCGMCGRSCAGGSCGSGVCSCPSGSVACNGSCVSTATDPNNCGTCSHVCSPTQSCDAGFCGCPTGQTQCNGVCIPTEADNLNCGQCNKVCPSGQYCSAGACVAPFICQTNYNAPPPGCGAFPLDLLKCGQPGPSTVSGPFTGTLTATNQSQAQPFTVAIGERMMVTNTVTGGGNFETTLNTSWPIDVAKSNDSSGVTPKVVVLSADATPYVCANPINARVLDSCCGTVNFSLQLEKISLTGRHNTGAPAFSAATALATDAGVACDQTCGEVNKQCQDKSDDRQHYQLSIPARKAALFEFAIKGSTSGGANVHIGALQPNGNAICNLVDNVIAGSMWTFYKARLVNNTGQAQTVIVYPLAWGFGGFQYQLAAGIEP
jgi:hypothetical protein